MIIKVLSYNIHKGFGVGNWRFTLHEIRTAIRETGADICLLQEVVGLNENHSRQVRNWPTAAQFEFLADTVWHHHSYGKNAVFPSRHHGNAVLSKFPIVRTQNRDISTNRFERRGLLHCEIHIPEQDARVQLFNTHLNLLHNSRRRQLNWILESLEDHPKSPLILAGDFNDWSGELTAPLTDGTGLKESFHGHQGEHAKTYPSWMPVVGLDRIYYRHLQLIQQRVLDFGHWRRLSDHLPLFVEFEI